MQLKQLYENKKTVLSFEVFPPKADSSIESIFDILGGITQLKPDFVSVTYGASGNKETIKYSQTVASIIKNQYDTQTLFHLTCVNSKKSEIDDIVDRLKKNNISNILALRGDIPKDFDKSKIEYKYATDLIKDLKSRGDFCVAAACYPEGHIECDNYEDNFVHLKQKQDAGADFFISQLFFDNRFFYEFRDQAIKAGVTAPLVAGIMPLLGKDQVSRMIYMCGSSLPAKIVKILHKYENNPTDLKKAGIEHAIEQATDLIENGVDGVHLYTMNQPNIATEVSGSIKHLLK